MKRLLSIALILLAVTVTTANSKSGKVSTENTPDDMICSAECSFTFDNGYTVGTRAGSIFRSCETAARLCEQRLAIIVAEFY